MKIKGIKDINEAKEMLKGLKESLKVFRIANDRETIYSVKYHIRSIEQAIADYKENN